MQYKNPVDNELVNAATEAHHALMNICEYIGMPLEHGLVLRLKNAVYNARQEMKMQEQDEGLSAPVMPPSSND